MIKKIIALNFLLILVYSCVFSPIYSKKNDDFTCINQHIFFVESLGR